MTKIKTQALTKRLGLWKNSIINKLQKENQDSTENCKAENMTRDMGNSHTPISLEDMTVHFDMTGLTREQAKAEIERLIDEKLERISHLELPEHKIDYKERERQRMLAAERLNERRNRRKEQSSKKQEAIFTEQGIYSDYKSSSVFDMIQPESFPFEEEQAEPISGQVSMHEMMQKIDGMNAETAEEIIPEESEAVIKSEKMKSEKISNMIQKVIHFIKQISGVFPGKTVSDDIHESNMNYALDTAIDKVFALFEKVKLFCQKGYYIAAQFISSRIAPKIRTASIKIEKKYQLKGKMEKSCLMFSEKEKVTSEKMAGFISLLDGKVEQMLVKFGFFIIRAVNRIDLILVYIERNRKKVLIESGIGIAVIALVMLLIGSMSAYEYIYNGKVLGVVKNQEDVYKTIDIIGDKLSYEYNAEIKIDKEKDIAFHKIYAWNSELDSKEDILNRLTYMRDMKANGYGVYVDGKLVAILDSKENAKEVLQAIQDRFAKKSSGVKYESVGFAEKVMIKNVETKLGKIQKKEGALEYMLTGATEKKIHAVQDGETFSEIAKMYGLKQSELQNSNPDVIPEKLKISQELCLTQIVPVVTVQTKEIATYNETIPFEIAYENTSTLYKNEKTVKSRGNNGEKQVVAKIVRNNGVEVSRTVLNSKTLTEPTSQVVLVGTKELPPLIGTGTFIYPIRGTLTSRYGIRWGRLHSGIDLAAPIGTNIKAADGGKVIFAGYNGSLGKCIKIDHGGGRVTLYGHCSKLFVKAGDRVFQGQHIANVGSTGHSTGPHVHFEVHINGKTKNPLNYL